MYEGSLALPYKDPVRIGPDTPLPRTRRRAVVLFVWPQLDRFASYTSTYSLQGSFRILDHIFAASILVGVGWIRENKTDA